MSFKSLIFLLFFSLILSVSTSYAEQEYTATEKGCVDTGGTMKLYMFYVDGNDERYELADEEIADKWWDKIWDLCNCHYDKVCKANFIYTTDKNDYRSGDSTKGLIRKFKSISAN